MPSARYSWRAMSANSWTSSSSAVAASPIGSGQADRPMAAALAPTASTVWRGSEEIVTGIPSRVDSASCCRRFDHSAWRRGSGAA